MGDTFIIVDGNSQGGYQPGHDFVIMLSGAANLSHLAAGDFI